MLLHSQSNVVIFDMRGNRIDNNHKGIIMIRQSDGTTKKLIVTQRGQTLLCQFLLFKNPA